MDEKIKSIIIEGRTYFYKSFTEGDIDANVAVAAVSGVDDDGTPLKDYIYLQQQGENDDSAKMVLAFESDIYAHKVLRELGWEENVSVEHTNASSISNAMICLINPNAIDDGNGICIAIQSLLESDEECKEWYTNGEHPMFVSVVSDIIAARFESDETVAAMILDYIKRSTMSFDLMTLMQSNPELAAAKMQEYVDEMKAAFPNDEEENKEE